MRFLTILALLLSAIPAEGQTGISTKPDGWHKSVKHPPNWYYQYKGWPVCYYNPDTGKFEVLDAKKGLWVQATPPWEGLGGLPWEQVENFGVDRGDIPPGEHWSINGRQVTREDWCCAVAEAGPPIVDDSNKWRLTCVRDPRRVTDEKWQQLLKDLAEKPELAELRGKVHLQAYSDPAHWHLAGFKLAQDARFLESGLGIYLQEPATSDRATSPVVQARYSYTDAAALRRIDPAYDPNKVPASDAAKPFWDGLKIDKKMLLLVGIAGLVAFLLWKKPEAKPQAGPAKPQAGPAPDRMTQIYDAIQAEVDRQEAEKKATDERMAKAAAVAEFAEKLRTSAKKAP